MLHCSLLKAIHPEWPTGVPPFLLFRGLCLRCLCLVSPSSPWLGFHGDYSPTAPTAPSLRPLIPSDSLIRCQSVQVYHHHLPPVGVDKSSESVLCSYIHYSYSVCSFFLFQRRLTSPQCSDNRFSNSDQRLDCSLHNLQPYGLPEGLAGCSSASQT
jgi:hypothetical protein